jgi:3-oxoacyl-[acyl-carrier-protein] synthase II
MAAWITGSAVRTCFGDGAATFAALTRGASGVAPLRYYDPPLAGVRHGYEVDATGPEELFRAGGWLTGCATAALRQAGVDPRRQRVVGLVGTGLRELRAVERHATQGMRFPAERLHFGAALAEAAPDIHPVLTLSNACSAGGYALALAQDLVELGEADAVLVGGADAMTASMLAMIGRVSAAPASQVRPFDQARAGVLLGEGAAALVVVPEPAAGPGSPRLARLLATGLSCDAGHETAPDADGILRAMRDALCRAEREPADVDLVVAHGTGTVLNDPTEALTLRELYAGCEPGPLVTGFKGATGHTSGGSALLSVAMVVESLRAGVVPPISGLREPLPEATGLRLVTGAAVPAAVRVAQVNAFGFGGVNAVTLVAAPEVPEAAA